MKVKITILSLMAFVCFIQTAHAQTDQHSKEQAMLKGWKAGEKVSLKSIGQFGPENCFQILGIDDALFSRMQGKSFKKNCTTPREDLRYLKVLHYNLDGNVCLGEIVCNKGISKDLIEIFKTLYDAKYPIERMVLIDDYDADDERSMAANNSSGFNFRFIAGTKRLSNHSQGNAIDINPIYNPYVKNKGGTLFVSPSAGKKYADRKKDFPYKIDHNDLCYKEFIKRGFIWGGDWTTLKDYQHFEKK